MIGHSCTRDALTAGHACGEHPARRAMVATARRPAGAAALAFVAAAFLAGCGDGPLVPTATPPSAPDATEVIAWNERARELVAANNTDPPMASRVYALLSVAQYRALVAAQASRRDDAGERGAAPAFDRAAAIGASASVLAALFPDEAGTVQADEEAALSALVDAESRERIDAGDTLGRDIARTVLEHARSDGSDAVWSGTVPTGPGMWYSSASPAQLPLRPMWGKVRPWVMTSGHQFRPAPPPAFGSPEFRAALAEVRAISDHRTEEQIRIARHWADGEGTITPPGHWNAIAAQLIAQHQLSGLEAARTLALLNMALMDAGISCWDAKFVYWLIRPSQADPAITTVPPLPNFPSYTSGHAVFSGAASVVLGHLFPAERDSLRADAEEAALSRVYGGIHYRFDSDRGLAQGRAIGELVMTHPAVLDTIVAVN